MPSNFGEKDIFVQLEASSRLAKLDKVKWLVLGSQGKSEMLPHSAAENANESI